MHAYACREVGRYAACVLTWEREGQRRVDGAADAAWHYAGDDGIYGGGIYIRVPLHTTRRLADGGDNEEESGEDMALDERHECLLRSLRKERSIERFL